MNIRWYYINERGKAHAFEIIGYVAHPTAHSGNKPIISAQSICGREFNNYGILSHFKEEKCCTYCLNILSEAMQ